MSTRFVAPIVFSTLVLGGCPKEPDPTKTPPEPSKTTAKLAVAEPKATGCEPAPTWVGIDACQEAGAVYATGRYKITTSGRLSRAVVAARARSAAGVAARLPAADGKMRVKDGEVPFVHRCDDSWVALAKVPGDPPTTVPACPKDLLSKAPKVPDGCPSWIARVGWKADDGYHGVGTLVMKKNSPLAQSGAKARALTAARAVGLSVIGVDGRSASIDSSTQTLQIASSETATCADRVWVHVTAKAP